jgi:hypothetical protein
MEIMDFGKCEGVPVQKIRPAPLGLLAATLRLQTHGQAIDQYHEFLHRSKRRQYKKKILESKWGIFPTEKFKDAGHGDASRVAKQAVLSQ